MIPIFSTIMAAFIHQDIFLNDLWEVIFTPTSQTECPSRPHNGTVKKDSKFCLIISVRHPGVCHVVRPALTDSG